MSQISNASSGGGSGAVDSVSGSNGVTASPTTGNVVVSGVLATTSTVGVASFNPADFTVDGAGEVSSTGSASSVLSVGMTVAQPITQNVLVDIIYDTSLVDTSAGYNATTGEYTVPTTDNYEITVTGNFLSTGGFINGDIFIRQNANFLFHGTSTASVSDPSLTVMNASIVAPLVAGDIIKISIFAQTVTSTDYVASAMANGFYNTMSIVAL